MFDRILIPVDGSQAADAAALRGFELAEVHDAEATVISVVELGPFSSIRLPGESASAEDAFRERAEAFVEAAVQLAADYAIDVTGEVKSGVPVTQIIDRAAEIDADLVVMASFGRSGIERVMLGSVAEGVARHGDVDVMLVKPDDVEQAQ